MKKYIIGLSALLSVGISAGAENSPLVIDGKEYAVDTLTMRQVGPGTVWMRLRIPDYPLNVNLLTVDLNDPNVRVETTQANEQLFGTERLVDAAKRQSSPGHTAIAGANGNFWCVSQSYPYSDLLLGTTFNANLRNGKILTETNCHADQWDTGPARIGEIGVTPDGRVFSDHFRWHGTITAEDGSVAEIHGANKVVRDHELVLINSYFGKATQFKPADQVWLDGSGRWGFVKRPGVTTEVYLKLANGATWSAGRDIEFEVVSKRTDAGEGTLGDADLVLLARGDSRAKVDNLEPGKRIKLNYAWTTMADEPIEFDNMIGGNGQVMIDGELTSVCQESENCALVYSKTGYGASADHKKLYIIVIDKSTDSRYGSSAGCTSAVMCQIARYYGCSNMTNLDSGGSAQMFVEGSIQNTTTEGTPRAVANGMMVYSVAPVDSVITRIEFAERRFRIPTSASMTPVVLGYNRYGHLVDNDVKDVVFSVDGEIGTVTEDGRIVVAGRKSARGKIKARFGAVETSGDIEVVEAPFRFKIENLVIDQHGGQIELVSTIDGKDFVYQPIGAEWDTEILEGDSWMFKIEGDGFIRGISNGVARLTAKLGGRMATATINVEIVADEMLPFVRGTFNADDWKITRSSVKTATVTPIGNNGGFRLTYDVSSARGPKVTLARDIRLWSCLTQFYALVDRGESELASMSVTYLPANSTRTITVPIPLDDTSMNMSETLNPSYDLAVYPITLKNIQFVPASKTGEFSVDVLDIGSVYYPLGGVEEVTVDSGADSDAPVEWYDLRGGKISPVNPAPGLYIVRRGGKTTKVVVNP